jgi:hypothetical protein
LESRAARGDARRLYFFPFFFAVGFFAGADDFFAVAVDFFAGAAALAVVFFDALVFGAADFLLDLLKAASQPEAYLSFDPTRTMLTATGLSLGNQSRRSP